MPLPYDECGVRRVKNVAPYNHRSLRASAHTGVAIPYGYATHCRPLLLLRGHLCPWQSPVATQRTVILMRISKISPVGVPPG